MKKHLYICLMLPALQAAGAGPEAASREISLKNIEAVDPGDRTEQGWHLGSAQIFDGYGASINLRGLHYRVGPGPDLKVEVQPDALERKMLSNLLGNPKKGQGFDRKVVLVVNGQIAEMPDRDSFLPGLVSGSATGNTPFVP